MWRWMLLIVVALSLQVGAGAQDDTKSNMRALIRQLDAPVLAERDEAERKLIELGPKILTLLPQTGSHTSAEVKQRVARIRQSVQQAAAVSNSKASCVTLHASDMRLSKILTSIEDQTGNRIVDTRQRFGHAIANPKLNVDFDKSPFWLALDQVLDKANLTIYPFGDQRTIEVVERPDGMSTRYGKASYSGPFRFEAVRIIAKRELRNSSNSMLQVVLEVAWEPRLQPICLKQRLADVRAFDSKDKPLTVDSSQAELEVPVNPRMMTVELRLPLELPSREVKRVSRLEGTLKALLPGPIETFRFDDLNATDVERRAAGVTVVLERVRMTKSICEVRIRVRFEHAADALESHRGWIFDNGAFLVKKTGGKRIKNDGLETTSRSKNEIGIAYLFDLNDSPDDYTFVYKTPSAITSASFKYEIKDIRLP